LLRGAFRPVQRPLSRRLESCRSESLERFTELLRIDTSNPRGNETKAATYLKQILEKEGIPCQLFSLEPDRANLVARLKGNGPSGRCW
jgi:acetylornithine deacetylase/succinyl-diaminopimelate desuccinylase-like protein